MPKAAYITFLGRSTWALVNAYHAVLREKGFWPEQVYIIAEEPYTESTQKAAGGIGIISESFGLRPEVHLRTVPEADFAGAGRMVGSLVRTLGEEGFVVGLDITSGRKAMVAGALVATARAGLEIRHIYYLAMKSIDNVAKPYMMIPFQIQQIRDFTREQEAALSA
ncbi:hypothetical protein FGU65_06065 [Methanoculleus sp. FWC-SCC1]|uniref:Uncharacterized protein n=1 Tax=Methanoculleus frigidifontis TaxID=2584085 RepID=A0ABT8M941_9EURY|nr:hypothetical protein [Methanoculleus sp. FWC-SCC1]MDN7024457.1 hypothetical protein [Methanoculleus sp. FWC-SCC1]